MAKENRKSYIEFQRRQLELSKETQDVARKLKLEANYDRWMNTLPDELKIATPGRTPKSLISKMRDIDINPPFDKSCIITSTDSSASLFTSHVLINVLIKQGIVTPSQIKKTSLLEGYNNINGMFESRKWKDYFFDQDSKVLLIENSSKSLTSMAPRGEDQFWKELLEMNRYNDKLIIINYTMSEEENNKGLFIPALTNDSNMNSLLLKSSKFIRLSDEEKESIKNEQRKIY